MLALALVALAQFGQPDPGYNGPRITGPASVDPLHPILQFAIQSGIGMTAACTGTTPTGTLGETLTFSRASSGTCLKHGTTTGIANGDLVTVSTDQPRVMPGGDGTSWSGILVENAVTNLALRSQEIDNVVWTKSAGGAGVAPTVTADFAVAPDNTTTAERVQFGACPTLNDASLVYQIGLGTSNAYTGSAFCKGTSADQTISVCVFGSGGGAICSQVTCFASSWSLISQTSVITTNGGPVFGCNHSSAYAGNASTGAADVLLWGAQYELSLGAPTSYIATAGAAATRATENGKAYFTISATTFPALGSVSLGATWVWNSTAGTALQGVVALYDNSNGANPFFALIQNLGTMRAYSSNFGYFGSGANTDVSNAAIWADSASASHQLNGGTITTIGSAGLISAPTRLIIGSWSDNVSSSAINGVVKSVNLDNSSTRVR